MKISFLKFQPRVIKYKDYEHFENNILREWLWSKLGNVGYEQNEQRRWKFLNIFKKNVYRCAYCNQRCAKDNHLPFIRKDYGDWWNYL